MSDLDYADISMRQSCYEGGVLPTKLLINWVQSSKCLHVTR